MKPRPFTYIRPAHVTEAVNALAQYGESARVLAGGQSLVAMLNLRLVDAVALIDISRLAELSHLNVQGQALEVGAAVTQNRLLAWPGLAARLPLLAKTLPFVGHFQTRNRGTVCGSIAHADPSSELPLALALLQGEVVLKSKLGTRTLKASQFQTGMLSTARLADELIVAVRFPLDGKSAAFREVARRHGDFAIVAVGACKTGANTVRLGIGGAASRPFVCEVATGTDKDIAEQIENIVWQLDGYEDIHATPRMRRDLVRHLAPLVIQEARG
jgi:2-furoyl-CoA dehydrogenase FAD binding subunit